MQRNAAWAVAIALGAAALGLQLAPAVLAPAAPCPGLLERGAVLTAQIARSAPLGELLLRADRAIFFFAIVLFGRVAIAVSGSWLAAGAVTLAFAGSSLFAPAMSPFDPFVAALVSLVALLALRQPIAGDRAMRWIGLCLVLIVLALVPVALPAWIMPPLPSPFDPNSRTHACDWTLVRSGAAGVTAAFSSVGTYGVLLGVFGLFTIRARLSDRRVLPLMAYVAAAFLAACMRDANASRYLAAAVIVLWLLASVGLAEVVRTAGSNVVGRLGAVVLAALVPLVPIAARYRTGQSSPIVASAFGHDRMTFDGMRRALQLLPPRSILVEEDATVDLLLRATSATWQRSGKTLQLVDRNPDAVASAATDPSQQVFAFPAAQMDLSKEGFELSDDALPGVSGIAVVKSGGVCQAIDETWSNIDSPSRAPMLVLRSEKPDEEGAVAMWFGSAHPIGLMPVGWPDWVVPGFLPVDFAPADKPVLEQEAAQDGLTGHEPVLEQSHVTRLEVWKFSGAPRLLPISLGADPPPFALVHATPGVTLKICPGYAHVARAIVFP